jgi:hypothetical protein
LLFIAIFHSWHVVILRVTTAVTSEVFTRHLWTSL